MAENKITERVTRQQTKDGIDVGREWFGLNVPDGTEDEMWRAFITAYNRDFPVSETDGLRYPATKLGKVTRQA